MKTLRTLIIAAACGTVAALSLVAPQAHAQAVKPTGDSANQIAGIESRVVDRLWENTDAYWHKGDYNRIVSLLRVCVEVDPNFDEAYSSGAWLLWSLGDKPAANAFLDNAVKRANNKWLAHYTFAENLMVRKEYAAALPHLQEATKSPYAPVISWKMLGHAYEKTGALKKSQETWEYVVKKFPEDATGPINLRRVKAKVDGSKG